MKILEKIRKYPKVGLVILAYTAFIALGMPDGLLGVAWPSIRRSFAIPLDSLGFLVFASTGGYLISSFFSGRLISHLGIGRVLAASCFLTGIALFGYTLVPAWWMVVGMGVLAGMGAGAIDAGLNNYMAAHFGEGLMQWLHASYGIGVTSGPIIMTVALNTFQSWQVGYITVGAIQLLLSAGFIFTFAMWIQNDHAANPTNPRSITDYRTPMKETLAQPRVWLRLVQFFLYTGAEVTLGIWAYTLLTESRGVPVETAGLWAGSYWAMFTVGRIFAGLYARRVGINRLVLSSLAGGLLGSALLWWNTTPLANLAAVSMVGFFIAPVFPGLVSGTSRSVGARYATNTIGIQAASAGLGASLVPSLVGVLARAISLEVVPVSMFILFLVQIVLYWAGVANKPIREG